MRRVTVAGCLAATLACAWVLPLLGEEKMTANRERSAVADKYKWNLADLYPSLGAWEESLAALEGKLEQVAACKGVMGLGSSRLADCLTLRFDILQHLTRLFAYADRQYHIDLKVSEAQALADRIGKVATAVEARLSFFEPELLAIPDATLNEWRKDKALADFESYLYNTTRRRAHIRSGEVETVVAQAGDMAAGSSKVYQTLATVNVPWPEVKLADGSTARLDQAGYGKLRYLSGREDRLAVFHTFWKAMAAFRETFAGLLAAKVNTDRFYALVRGYSSDLEAALDGTDVPTAIYHNMVTQVRRGLPVLHRYLDLRKRVLKVDKLGYHDLYTSIVADVEMPVSYDEATRHILESHKVLGKEYTGLLEQAFGQRWVDVYPNPGKRTGAYSAGSVYDTHPFILLNYTDDYNSMSTTAHEFGHALHSFLSNRSQPFAKADYPTFVAEVASTVNENLLFLHMVGREKDKKKRLFLLGQALENFRTTVFRQALFAEFELRIHEIGQLGESLTADALDQLYLGLLREYYGEAGGHIEIDPLYAVEWSYIPHFYYNFYMFQYTTSFIAATSIARAIFKGDTKARDNYLGMLRAGGSRNPVGLLEMAGVNMGGEGPYEGAFKVMSDILDEIETLL